MVILGLSIDCCCYYFFFFNTLFFSPIHSLIQASIHSLCLCWCVRVWVCLVLWCLWLIFDFWFCVCGSVCIRGRRRWWGRWFCRWRRERKKRSKLEIIKIMYRRATVTVHICTVTVAFVHLCTILHPLMWVFFWSKCVKWVTFYVLQDYPWTDVVALIHRFLHL